MAVFDKNKLKKEKEKTVEKHTIMIVDDEEQALESMYSLLSEDYHIITARHGQEALDMIEKMDQAEKDKLSLIISDQRMPKLDGIRFFERMLERKIMPNTIRIILTGFSDIPVIIDAINKTKIYEFILKPFDPEDLKLRVKRAVEAFERQQELDAYRSNLEETFFSEGPKHPGHFKDIITKSQKMENIFKYIEAVAEFNSPVLITGETGTGKELIARAIHRIYKAVNKKEGNFMADNVAGWNEHLFSDNLYGHEKGAFSDAFKKREGLLKEAENGTLFLDEIGDLDLPLQTKLLRLIQEKQYFPLGSDKPQSTNARFIFATNKDINDMKEKGKFRTDLFFRLNTHHIHLPPLKERKEDVRPLVDYFVKVAAKEYNKQIPRIPDKLIALLFNYDFPGNIRELQGMVFEAVSLHQPGVQELSLDVFIKKIKEQGREIDFSKTGKSGIIFGDTLPTFEELKKIYTNEALKRTNNNQTRAAKMAELDRATFIRYWKGT